MNLFRGIYCRTFQLGLKIALPFLPYRTPRVVGSVKALPEVIRKKKCRRPLIITDPGIRKLGLLRGLEKALREAGVAGPGMPPDEAAALLIQAVKDMKKRFGIGDEIPEIQERDIPKLARFADQEANPLYPVPVLMDARQLAPFYYKLMGRSDQG